MARIETWKQLMEELEQLPKELLDSPVFLSCDPCEIDPLEGFRYHGHLDELMSGNDSVGIYFVGRRNDSQ